MDVFSVGTFLLGDELVAQLSFLIENRLVPVKGRAEGGEGCFLRRVFPFRQTVAFPPGTVVGEFYSFGL